MQFPSILSFLAVFVLAISPAKGQNITWEKTKHDFGAFPPDTRELSHAFTFKNSGSEPVKLKDVKTSCGCTTPEWPKKPIEPGESGKVKVVFDATTSDGYFRKSVTVLTEAPSMQKLTIEGEQQRPSKEGNVEGYEVEQGQLAFKKGIVDFGHMAKGSMDTSYLKTYNASNQPMLIKKLRAGKSLQAPGLPRTLQPKESTSIMVLWSSFSTGLDNKEVLGTHNGEGIFLTNDEAKPYKSFQYKAKVYPKIQKREEKHGEPEAKLLKKTLNFGKVGSNNLIKSGTVIENTGSAPLRIISTDTEGCGCQAPVPDKNRLEPGEQTQLRVNIKTSSYVGNVQKELDIYTNDPDNPYLTLNVKAFVD